MIYFEAPDKIDYLNKKEDSPILFLAGGISNCPNWQDIAAEKLSSLNIVLLNPRREAWDDSIQDYEQIKWEFDAIQKSTHIIFWFTPDTTNPITLFEYGKELVKRNKVMYVGCHPDYVKKNDVYIQSQLEFGDDFKLYDSLENLLDAVLKDFKEFEHV